MLKRILSICFIVLISTSSLLHSKNKEQLIVFGQVVSINPSKLDEPTKYLDYTINVQKVISGETALSMITFKIDKKYFDSGMCCTLFKKDYVFILAVKEKGFILVGKPEESIFSSINNLNSFETKSSR